MARQSIVAEVSSILGIYYKGTVQEKEQKLNTRLAAAALIELVATKLV